MGKEFRFEGRTVELEEEGILSSVQAECILLQTEKGSTS